MLALLFYIGDVIYTVKCEKVREIVPMVKLKSVPHAPEFFAGYFNYRGTIVPVIDLCRLINGSFCQMRLSTRIILIDYQRKDNTSYILGLVAERVTEMIRKPKEAFLLPSIKSNNAPYLGGIVMEKDEMIQYIDLDLLPDCINFLPESSQSGEKKQESEGRELYSAPDI